LQLGVKQEQRSGIETAIERPCCLRYLEQGCPDPLPDYDAKLGQERKVSKSVLIEVENIQGTSSKNKPGLGAEGPQKMSGS
jgi:hypothetical protein